MSDNPFLLFAAGLRQVASRRLAVCFLLAATAMLAVGCQSNRPAAPASGNADRPAYQQLTLTLHMATTNNRFTYFDLDADGVLWYGGGRQASLYQTEEAGQLTDAQREALWQVIVEYDLLEAGDRPFAKADKVTYQLQVRVGRDSHSFRAIDQQVPGLRQLHDLLFDYQMALRYD